MLLGIYNYTTILSYLNLFMGFLGIGLALGDKYLLATICLLIAGICDMFDGLVSRSKKNRTIFEKKYGIQIDSLADIISFGCLPIFINYALIQNDDIQAPKSLLSIRGEPQIYILFWFISSFYVLAALIRLSYFNAISEEKLQDKIPNNNPQFFIGIPVTFSAIIFPFIILIKTIISKIFKRNQEILINLNYIIINIYFILVMVLTFLFVFPKIKIKKPTKKYINILSFFSCLVIFLLIFLQLFTAIE
ncbi:CDP-diacylglycerol-serine O-phosphatidyltransferase [Candidatus Phytoplasma mali]|uniref:CDP-diacylglycerol-serine O-phosphatidyltransferase n=1 Tax=Phytoplasma mali (strain AT) TaxID=482235 RepID=B3R070_PHYMT|nr:CDP-alcohol phosphatidyltransferase family protein [Candidatus Phytoplasma mali]CAP18234.1 CDP-diacylglycerol-serine O-phosphatidyltransferase [Candidatus Phytoplasma mali]